MSSKSKDQPIAREYLRVSQDRSQRARSVDEQHTENERAASSNGWTLGQPYQDNDRSASRYAKKVREGYDTLIADLRADRFAADVLVLWESSRGSRKVSEWVELLELLEQRDVKVHVVSHARTYDPSNHRDRRSLLEDSVDSEYESGKTSDRVRRSAAAAAVEGRPNGRPPFGYRRIYDERTRELIRQEPDPETAPLVRELFARVHGGHSMRAVMRDWEARGITTGSGKPYVSSGLRAILVRRAYVGDRVHNPGSGHGDKGQPTALVTEGTWEPIIDRTMFTEVQRIINAPERRSHKSRPGGAVHLLSGIALCDVCSRPLVGRNGPRGPEYFCQRSGHLRVDEAQLDEVAEAVMLARLDDPDFRAADAADQDTSIALDAARNEIAKIKQELDDLYAQAETGQVSPVLAGRFEKGILARLDAAKSVEQALAKPSDLDRLFPSGTDWSTMPLAAKREVARRLLTVDEIGELRVTPRPQGKRGKVRMPAAERVRWNPPLSA